MRTKKVKVVQQGWAQVEVERTLFFEVPENWEEEEIFEAVEEGFDGADVGEDLGWEWTCRDADYSMPQNVENEYSEDLDDVEVEIVRKTGISFVLLGADEQLFPANFVEDVCQRVRKDTQQEVLMPTEVIERALNGTLEQFAYETLSEKNAEDFLSIMEAHVPKAAAAVKRLWLLGRQHLEAGGKACQILGRTIDPEQHLIELEELEQLTLPSVVD